MYRGLTNGVLVAASIIMMSITLTSCDNAFSNLDKIEFNDTIFRHSYTKDYGVATGMLNVYVVYGEYKLANIKVPAGVALTPQKFKRYRIKDLLEKYPDLASQEALKAEKEQKW